MARAVPTDQLFNCGVHGMCFLDAKAGLVMLKDVSKCLAVDGEPVFEHNGHTYINPPAVIKAAIVGFASETQVTQQAGTKIIIHNDKTVHAPDGSSNLISSWMPAIREHRLSALSNETNDAQGNTCVTRLGAGEVERSDPFDRLVSYSMSNKKGTLREFDAIKQAFEQKQRQAALRWSQDLNVVRNTRKSTRNTRKSLFAPTRNARKSLSAPKQLIQLVIAAIEEMARVAALEQLPNMWANMKANFAQYMDEMEQSLRELMAKGMEQHKQLAVSKGVGEKAMDTFEFPTCWIIERLTQMEIDSSDQFSNAQKIGLIRENTMSGVIPGVYTKSSVEDLLLMDPQSFHVTVYPPEVEVPRQKTLLQIEQTSDECCDRWMILCSNY